MQTFSVAIFLQFFLSYSLLANQEIKLVGTVQEKAAVFYIQSWKDPPGVLENSFHFLCPPFWLLKKRRFKQVAPPPRGSLGENVYSAIILYFYTCLGWKYFLPPHKVNRTCDWQDLCNGNSSDHAADTIVELRGIDLKPDFKKSLFLIPSLQ